MATSPRSRRARDALLHESRSALELLNRIVSPLELLGGSGAEIRALCADLDERLARDYALIELVGEHRVHAVEVLLGEAVLPAEPSAGATVRVRAGEQLTFRARRPDGRTELPPPDESDALRAQLDQLERQLSAANDEAARLADALQKATQARTALSAAPSGAITVPHRKGLRAWFARLMLFFTSLFRRRRALPAPQIDPAQQAAEAGARVAVLEQSLAAVRQELAAGYARGDELRQAFDAAHTEHARRIRERLLALAGAADARPVDVEVAAPGIPDGVVLLLRAATELWREPVAGKLLLDAPPGAELRTRLEQIRDARPSEIARRLAAAVCDVRNQVTDFEQRARSAHQQRIDELVARRVPSPDGLRRDEHAAAQLPVARHAARIVEEAATQLETLLAGVRADWERRIGSCAGLEQLRAEVAAVENGAAHRLTLVCDELRDLMTVQFVRLVLELSRPLRQELLHRRLEVARGSSARLAETFEDIRVVLPSSLETAFQPLRTPGVGELLSTERGLLDPLLRTLSREKKACLQRLAARLDDIQRTTTRELYAAAVFLSPLLLNTFAGLVDELVREHHAWLDARVADEEREYQSLRVRQGPALAMVDQLEAEEARLANLLEAYAAAAG